MAACAALPLGHTPCFQRRGRPTAGHEDERAHTLERSIMKNWYKRPVTKGILLLLAHVMAAAAVISLVIIIVFSGNLGKAEFFKLSSTPYEESDSFNNLVSNAVWDVMSSITLKNNFETDGKYNPSKLVDIVDLGKNGQITGENESGLAYKLEDLENWSKDYIDEGHYNEEGNIVVCQKPDGTYHYYYTNEFRSLIEDGTLRLEVADRGVSTFLDDLEMGYYTSGGAAGNIAIKNTEGKTEYSDCWTFNEVLDEKYAPEGADNILEVINRTPELNGKLSKVFSYMQEILLSISEQIDNYLYAGDTWEEGNTNFTYIFVNQNEKKVYTNRNEYKDFESLEENLNNLVARKDSKYLVVMPKLSEFKTNMDISASEWRSMIKNYTNNPNSDYIFAASVDTKFPVQDVFYSDAQEYNTFAPYLKLAAFGSVFCSILFLAILVWLTLIAGRSNGDEGIHLNFFDKLKTELGGALVFFAWLFLMLFIVQGWGGIYNDFSVEYVGSGYYTSHFAVNTVYPYSLSASDLIITGFIAVLTTAFFFIGYMSLVRRIKAKTLWKNSLLRSIGLFFRTFWYNRNVTFRAAAVLAGFILFHWFGFMVLSNGGGWFILLVFLAEAAAVYFVIKNAVAKSRIKTGIQEIASGNVNYQIPVEGLKGENLEMARMVNDIGNGLQRALIEGMKSERLKTDLITNVSHDIKTPLTSIINYVDLLKRENFDDPKIQGYLEILEAKAQRLKTLTEDVVEASKVSSGNITLEQMDVNFVEMINQTEGEFAEKLEAKKLEVVQSLPEEPVVIHVDGRRLWRVLENIYNNAAKYAMPGTPVYADLIADAQKVSFSLKNISEHPLNISADELTERFIRGDISRSTEGSGLGLSIAKSLTQMMGGEFRLYLDGDLFKVTIEFPRVR